MPSRSTMVAELGPEFMEGIERVASFGIDAEEAAKAFRALAMGLDPSGETTRSELG